MLSLSKHEDQQAKAASVMPRALISATVASISVN